MLVALHLFSLFFLVLLGFYVFVSDPRKRSHQTFAAFIAFLALWTTKDLIFWNFYDAGTDWRVWAGASFVIAMLMQFALVVFAWVFPENSRTPRRKAAMLFAPSLVLVPATALGFLWDEVAFRDGRFVVELRPLAYVFVAYVYAVYVYGGVLLFRKYLAYRGTQRGQQLASILWGLALTGLMMSLANVVLPYFDRYELVPFSAVLTLPGALAYAFAILNFKLFSLQTALNQFRLFPIAYKVALSIASVAISSFLLLQVPIVWWSFRGGVDAEGWRRYLVFSIISALVPNLLLVLLILRTISRPLQRITLAAVAVTKGEYGTEVDLRRTNDEIGLLAESFNEMSRKMAADIRELQRLNEQLIHTERLAAMGTLAAGVAHEVNNPLASLSSLIQMMQRDGQLDEISSQRLKLVAEQIRRISQVTKDLTDFGRVRPAVRRPLRIADVVEKSLRLANFDEAFQKLDVRLAVPGDLPTVSADADQLQQVFLNLLLNAKDAMPEGGRLTIAARHPAGDRAVEVEIADEGHGIPAELSNKIFDPFFTTKAPGKGTGLGLAVCYAIVTAHGGRIAAEPLDTGGTRFVISLPAGSNGGISTPAEGVS
ncbi:MAG: ATP-binding protein [Pyrinomonadaceae bacterium]